MDTLSTSKEDSQVSTIDLKYKIEVTEVKKVKFWKMLQMVWNICKI